VLLQNLDNLLFRNLLLRMSVSPKARTLPKPRAFKGSRSGHVLAYGPTVRSNPSHEHQHDENDQNDADDTDVTVAVTAEAATETADQNDDKYKSERLGSSPLLPV